MLKHKENIYILIRSWNSFQYFDRCINSIFQQQTNEFKIIFIDDNSDYSSSQKKYIEKKLNGQIVIFNRFRKFSLRNAYESIHKYVNHADDIIVNLDSDDWFIGNSVLDIIKETYKMTDCLFTYGNCQQFDGERLLTNSADLLQPTNSRYDKNTEQTNTFRLDHFRPNHLRTWKAKIFKKIKKTSFLGEDKKNWIKYNEDLAIYFPMLEMAKTRYEVIEKSLYAYNCANPLNDKKIHLEEKLFEEVFLRKQTAYENCF